jgi:hypothetical protein
MLIGLLRLAETSEEREPILEVLRAHGIEKLLSNLRDSGLMVPADHDTSIHHTLAHRNAAPQMSAGTTQALDSSPATPRDPSPAIPDPSNLGHEPSPAESGAASNG